MLALLADRLELRLPFLPGVLPRLRVPRCWGRLTPLALLVLLTLVSVLARVLVLALLGVRAWLWTRDLWLGWLEGAVLVFAHLGDLELPRPGVKPMCPASAGGFLSTVPPGKLLNC